MAYALTYIAVLTCVVALTGATGITVDGCTFPKAVGAHGAKSARLAMHMMKPLLNKTCVVSF